MISGYTIVHNAIRGDYCIELCVESLLACCDEVVIGHRASDDGTGDLLSTLAARDSRIRIIEEPWHQPFNDASWFIRWINSTRAHLRHPHQLMLDADEVLHPDAARCLLALSPLPDALWFERLNFWRDTQTLIGRGETCGWKVARFGLTTFPMPSDEPYAPIPTDGYLVGPEPAIRQAALSPDPLPQILHYGFLRAAEGFFEKCQVNLRAFRGRFDLRVGRAMLQPSVPYHTFFQHKLPYGAYTQPHPEFCLPWLRARGRLPEPPL